MWKGILSDMVSDHTFSVLGKKDGSGIQLFTHDLQLLFIVARVNDQQGSTPIEVL